MMFEAIGALTIGLLILLSLGLLIWSLIWVYNDAEKRGKPGLLVALMVFLLSWPISLLVWLVFRPDVTRGLKKS
jgi:hypothetical protein